MTTIKETGKSLYRYTQIPDLLDMLMNKKLFLSDPNYWKDKTDAAFLKKYVENKDKKVRAICFFKKPETNQYWELYGKKGCMIKFDADKLLEKISGKDGFEDKEVRYLKQSKFKLEAHGKTLPFIKQLRYKGESEHRIVWTGKNPEDAFIPVDFGCINRIYISGDIREEIADSLKTIIRGIPKITGEVCAKKIEIVHSQLYENKVWLNKIKLNK